MKSRVNIRSPTTPSYLKPGALAQLRNSKINARSKQIGARTHLALSQFEHGSGYATQPLSMDGFPCFKLRVSGFTRCLQRKKLIAVTPFFSETSSKIFTGRSYLLETPLAIQQNLLQASCQGLQKSGTFYWYDLSNVQSNLKLKRADGLHDGDVQSSST